MIRTVHLCILLIIICRGNITLSQINDVYNLFLKYQELVYKGDFINAQGYMISVIECNDTLPLFYRAAAYNNLGLIKRNLGLYNEALNYYNIAENISLSKSISYSILADIYINKSRIFTFYKSYNVAIEYIEKAIRIYKEIEISNDLLYRISIAYLNLGIIYYESMNYNKALEYFLKSLNIRLKLNNQNIGLTYLNLAKTYFRLGEYNKAESFFLKSIESFEKEYGAGYYRTAEVYFEYAQFLQSTDRKSEALKAHEKALSICLKSYGPKHPLTSLVYKNTGDFYFKNHSYDTALIYYQKALIAISRNFEDTDIFSNPLPDSSIFDIRLLEVLKSKTTAFEQLAENTNEITDKTRWLQAALGTAELAVTLIEQIRNGYPDEESKAYLAENEKETYVSAVHIAYSLMNLKRDLVPPEKVYEFASKCKAAILRSEIAGRDYLITLNLPDSISQRKKQITSGIAGYNHLIIEESQKLAPDSSKIRFWKDALFEMRRENEQIEATINALFPSYRNLLEKTETVPLKELQKNLERNETVLDYLISSPRSEGKRIIYAFVITRNNLHCFETEVDSSFTGNARTVLYCINSMAFTGKNGISFNKCTEVLNYMYKRLIMPYEKLFRGKRLIIIPDEEISWLPFEAFLRKMPEPGFGSYEGLDYLINNYSFTYNYSSGLLKGKNVRFDRKAGVYAFLPGYEQDNLINNQGLMPLEEAEKEIENIFRWFPGKKFTSAMAQKEVFMQSLNKSAVFHLAMHSLIDTSDSRFSCLLFDSSPDSTGKNRLYNYEISLSNMNSPMVVLSACNSGTGSLHRSEGVISLARSFLLAGASSVVRTKWDINDETSAKIMSSFYKYLSKGKTKDRALRQAKLDYLATMPPVYSNPYYWGAYELLGDNSSLATNKRIYLLVTGSIIILCIPVFVIYLRRRTIFRALSR